MTFMTYDFLLIQLQEFQSLSQGHAKQNISISGFSHFKPSELVDPWKYKDWLSECDQLSRPVSTFNKPELIDVQGYKLFFSFLFF